MARKLEHAAHVAERLHRGGIPVQRAWELVERALAEQPAPRDLNALLRRCLELDREDIELGAVPERHGYRPAWGCVGCMAWLASGAVLLWAAFKLVDLIRG